MDRHGVTLAELLESAGFDAEILAAGEPLAGVWPVPVDLPPPPWLGRSTLPVVEAGRVTRSPGDAFALLRARGVSALVVAGRGSAPAKLRRAASETELAVGWIDARVVDAVEQLGRAVVEHDRSDLALRLQAELTEISVRGGELEEVAETLGRMIGCSVTIEDTNYRIIASWVGEHDLDDVRRLSIEEGRTPAVVIRDLERYGWIARMRSSRAPLRIRGVAELDMRDRIVCPIRAGERLYGYLSILEEEPLGPAGLAAAQHGATVAALHLAQTEAVVATERRLRGTFIDDVLSGSYAASTDHLRERAALLGFDLDAHYAVCVCELRRPDGTADPDARAAFLDAFERFYERRRPGLFHRAFATRVAFIAGVASDDEHELADELAECARALGRAVRGAAVTVGCGTVRPGVAGIADSYREAREALSLAYGSGTVAFYADLRRLRLVDRVGSSRDLASFSRDVLGPLAAPRTSAERRLKETLQGLAAAGFRKREAAERLFVHRNTLRERVARAERLTGLDLDAPADQMLLQLALDAELVLRERFQPDGQLGVTH